MRQKSIHSYMEEHCEIHIVFNVGKVLRDQSLIMYKTLCNENN